jgi:hypothetical protein
MGGVAAAQPHVGEGHVATVGKGACFSGCLSLILYSGVVVKFRRSASTWFVGLGLVLDFVVLEEEDEVWYEYE